MNIKTLLIALVSLTLVACGSTPQPTVTIDTNVFAKPGLKVGYYSKVTEKNATTHIYGASCLLCYGVASALTSSLDKHLEATVTPEELVAMKELVASEYKERVTSFEDVTFEVKKLKKFKGHKLGFAEKDYTSLKEKLGVDVLVVFEVYAHGAYRGFTNYVPTTDPQGYVSGLLYAIDLETNAYVQYLKINEMVQPQSEWDEPPTFPSVTTSYYQAVENVKTKIKDAI